LLTLLRSYSKTRAKFWCLRFPDTANQLNALVADRKPPTTLAKHPTKLLPLPTAAAVLNAWKARETPPAKNAKLRPFAKSIECFPSKPDWALMADRPCLFNVSAEATMAQPTFIARRSTASVVSS